MKLNIAAVGLLLMVHMGLSATARALQVLHASDHGELAAEISDREVNRIALDGDRVSRVIQSPGGFTVEHDPVRGDLYLYPDAMPAAGSRLAPGARPAPGNRPAPAGALAPVTLYVGTERGFTYRLTLSAAARDSAQILIRNPAVARPAAGGSAAGGPATGNHKTELVALIVAIVRGEPVPGYVIVPAPESAASHERGALLESWRGPRFNVRLLSVSAERVEDATGLARLSRGNVAGAWLSPPGRGPNGERIAVLVEHNDALEPAR